MTDQSTTAGLDQKKLHVALGVADVESSVSDYSARLSCSPTVHVRGEYALWRTQQVNLSIRRAQSMGLRHLGWEDPSAAAFSSDTDVNGIVWEHFAAEHQLAEIADLWPEAIVQQTALR